MSKYKELADRMAAGSYTVRHCREIEAILRSLDAQPQQASKPLSDAEILGCAHDKTTGLSPWGIGSIKTDYINAVRRTITAFCQKNGIKERG